MDECDTLLKRRYHAAYGAPVEDREGFELVAVLDVKYGQRGRPSSGCGIFLSLLDQRPPLHAPIGREDTRVGQSCVEEGPQHAIWLPRWHVGELGRPVVCDTVQDDFQECTKGVAVFRAAFRAVESGG